MAVRRNPAVVPHEEADVRVDQVLERGSYDAGDWSMRLGRDGVIRTQGIVPYPVEDVIRTRGHVYRVSELDQDDEIGIIVEAPSGNLAYVFLSGGWKSARGSSQRKLGKPPAARLVNPEDWRATYRGGLPIYVAIHLDWKVPAGSWRDQFVIFDEHGIDHAADLATRWLGSDRISVNQIEPGSLEWRHAIVIAREATERINIYQWADQLSSELGLSDFLIVVPAITEIVTDKHRIAGAKRASRSFGSWEVASIQGSASAIKKALQRLMALADQYGKSVVTTSQYAGIRWEDYGFAPDDSVPWLSVADPHFLRRPPRQARTNPAQRHPRGNLNKNSLMR